MTDPRPTACLLVIGDEVLSGRTRDANIQFLGQRLGELGIPLREVRVIPDDRAVIVATIRDVRDRFTYVFTTGGIGPTHDDITSECVAEAFGVPWVLHPEAYAEMAADYAARTPPVAFNDARQRMATVPEGAVLIRNPVSVAPGFRIGNVHVMAGVPRIMQAMFEAVAPTLAGGHPIVSRTVHAAGVYEGTIAAALSAIQAASEGVALGSYPYDRAGGTGVAIVGRGTDAGSVEAAMAKVTTMLREAGAAPVQGEPG